MREQILKMIEDATLAIHPVGDFIGRNDIVDSPIPDGIKHFLLSTLDRRAELEASDILYSDSQWFDSRDTAYMDVVQQAILTLHTTARFPASEWRRAVRQAAESVLDYLISPGNALAAFIFADDVESISTTDLQRRTGYFSDYSYITKAVDAFLSRRSEKRITRKEFQSTITHLDSEITAGYETEAWMSLLRPILSLMDFTGQNAPGLPVKFAVQFFSDKKNEDISEVIASAAAQHRAEMITSASLETIIAGQLDSRRAKASEPTTLFDEPKEAPTPEIAAVEKPSAETTEQEMPLWKKFQKKTGTSSSGSESNENEDPLWKRFESKSQTDILSSSNSKRARELEPSESYVPDEDPIPILEAQPSTTEQVVLGAALGRKERFIRDLFNGDEGAFSDVMDALAAAPDWTTATSIIAERVFRPFRVDIYSEVAVEFTDAVESRYSGKQT